MIGRPRSCQCGDCHKCKRAAYMRTWYGKKTLEERREHVAQRNPITTRDNDRKRYVRHRQARMERMRDYAKTESGKEAIKLGRSRWESKNIQKKIAHTKVRRAIQSGKLSRLPCEVCGSSAQAHHDDYSQPLKVRWLCTTHHAAWHAFDRSQAEYAI